MKFKGLIGPETQEKSNMSKLQICTRCVLPESFPGISFDQTGVCSKCREHDRRWDGWDAEMPRRQATLHRLCEDARRKARDFDALVPISGGKDSMYVLHTAVKSLGLRCLAFTFDNGYLSEHARRNIDLGCRILGIDHIYYRVDPGLLNRLYALFMSKAGYFCSVCMCAMSATTELVANQFDIPLVLLGSSHRTELVLSPEMFQQGDPGHLQSVLCGEPIATECDRLLTLPTLRRRIGYRLFLRDGGERLRLYGKINLPDYVEWDYAAVYRTIQDELGWKAPPDSLEHTDCSIHPVTTYLHNRRFPGLEIRRLTMARLIMAGQITRAEALRTLSEEPEEECPEPVMRYFLENLDMTRQKFDHYVDLGARHLQYRTEPGLARKLVRRIIAATSPSAGDSI